MSNSYLISRVYKIFNIFTNFLFLCFNVVPIIELVHPVLDPVDVITIKTFRKNNPDPLNKYYRKLYFHNTQVLPESTQPDIKRA
jgi:hypothetical protein